LLLLGVLVVRGKWFVAMIGAGVAFVLSTLIILRYGLDGTYQTFQNWLALSLHGDWPTRAQNQSLFAALFRTWPGDVKLAHTIASLVLIALVILVFWTRRNLPVSQSGGELAFALAVAVILSPIAWEHYWVLLFPILQTIYSAGTKPILRRIAFWIAAALITGPSPLLVGESGYNLARELSNSTLAAILVIGILTPVLLRKELSQPRGPIRHG
jgi:hypothetical protein